MKKCNALATISRIREKKVDPDGQIISFESHFDIRNRIEIRLVFEKF
jgi:hypothetical protein